MPGPVASGFYGKLPARGDFVRAGLPRDFTDPWDAWLATVMTGSRTIMGDDWLPAFLEAPVWRFTLPAGLCGSQAVLGLMLPSVDRAGRYFPLTFAALSARGIEATPADTWLDACEAAGRAALEQDTPPQEIAGMLAMIRLPEAVSGTPDAIWWSEGSDRVAPARITLRTMPGAATYAAMLGARTQGADEAAAPGEGKWESTS
ncbi:MAG: type VI secretion system-associated protein TagF [Acetobacteraceae bacterium]